MHSGRLLILLGISGVDIGLVMTLHKLTAGDGYTYLTPPRLLRTVTRLSRSLADHVTSRANRWQSTTFPAQRRGVSVRVRGRTDPESRASGDWLVADACPLPATHACH